MKRTGRFARSVLLMVSMAGLTMLASGPYPRAEETRPSHLCPLCQAEGVPIPARDKLGHCECEKWWVGSPARVAFGDCSSRECQEGMEPPKPIWIDLPLYRCPKDGLLFTEAEE